MTQNGKIKHIKRRNEYIRYIRYIRYKRYKRYINIPAGGSELLRSFFVHDEFYVMMETFIVLGLCFILYEALDLFHSCYNNPQHPQNGDSGCANNGNGVRDVDSASVNKDTARLVALDSIDEIDSDDNQSVQLGNNKVYSICDRIDVHGNNDGNLIVG